MCFSYILVQQPGSWEYERDIGDPENDSRPIDGAAADVEVARRDVTDDGELDPVHGVGAGAQYKYCQHQPAPLILSALPRERWHHCLLHCYKCCPQLLQAEL